MKFQNPEMKIVLFDVEDILTVSGEEVAEPTARTADCYSRTPEEDL